MVRRIGPEIVQIGESGNGILKAEWIGFSFSDSAYRIDGSSEFSFLEVAFSEVVAKPMPKKFPKLPCLLAFDVM